MPAPLSPCRAPARLFWCRHIEAACSNVDAGNGMDGARPSRDQSAAEANCLPRQSFPEKGLP